MKSMTWITAFVSLTAAHPAFAASSPDAKIAKAEQAVAIAECKLKLVRDTGLKTNTKEYFGFMFQCLSK